MATEEAKSAIVTSTEESTPAIIATTEEAKSTIILKSSDDETFEISQEVAKQSQTIKHMIEDNCADSVIPVPNVRSLILSKVIEYCKRHVEYDNKAEKTKEEEDELKKFDTAFVDVEQVVLFDVILAANYLNIKNLLDLMCQTVANMMKGKTPEQIRDHFHIKNDYTAEEEAEIRKENAWAFE